MPTYLLSEYTRQDPKLKACPDFYASLRTTGCIYACRVHIRPNLVQRPKCRRLFNPGENSITAQENRSHNSCIPDAAADVTIARILASWAILMGRYADARDVAFEAGSENHGVAPIPLFQR